MRDLTKFYIDGEWVDPHGAGTLDVINPATETAFARIALGDSSDVDRAVRAAQAAFPGFSNTSIEERKALLQRIIDEYLKRNEEMARAITEEMGAPKGLALHAQSASSLGHFMTAMKALDEIEFEQDKGSHWLVREPIGVCALITPWNWPMNQITCKVAPALAAGCTMVLKPSEVAPFSAHIFAEILHSAGVPKGVFNLVDGMGPEVGSAMSSHPGVDMVSFTGSTRAGVEVAKNAAPTVKRVAQELGGKSANIILDDADFKKAVSRGVMAMMNNSGQSCNAPSRMLVPAARMDEAIAIARDAAAKVRVGDPNEEGTVIGPVVNETQWNKIQALIKKGMEEGAELVAGGADRPDGLDKGYYVKPTIFARADNQMTIAREEIFGPVLTIIPYKDEDDAVAIANDTPYGLSGYVYSGDINHARKVAKRIRAGNIHLNGAGVDATAPFGGYKQSGNGREWGTHGVEEFLETKAVLKPLN
ncbi:MAG: aldehyde dehydrogenase family protein [Parvularculaceae bacterium]|nr:aldehyde dehydrogenase family protein [Parvularculaceae bacterium]